MLKAESESLGDDLEGLGLFVGVQPLVIGDIPHLDGGVLQPTGGFVACPTHTPTGAVGSTIDALKFDLRKPLPGSAAKHSARIGSPSLALLVFFIAADRTAAAGGEPRGAGEQGEAHGIEQGGLSAARLAGDGKQPRARQRRAAQIDLKVAGKTGEVSASDDLNLHASSSVALPCMTPSSRSWNDASNGSGGSPS